MILPLLLLPLLVSSAFLGEDLVKDQELDTTIDYNGKGWTTERGILYSYELRSPQQKAVKKGIVLSTDFSSEVAARDHFLKETLTVGKNEKSVYVLPFRNMQQITCSDKGWNDIEFYANKTQIKFWVDLWGSDCRTLASLLDSARQTRQSLLTQTVKDLSNYANSYIEADRELGRFESETQSIEKSIEAQEFAIKTTELTINAFQDQIKAKEAEITTALKNNADLSVKIEGLNLQSSQNKNKVEGIEDSIQKLQVEESSNQESKAGYDKNAEDALAKIEELMKQLIVEAPTAKELEGLTAALQASKDLNEFDRVLRSVLPA